MGPGLSRREFWGWLGVVCLLMFGIGYVLSQRLRQAGPMEFHPDRSAPVAASHEKELPTTPPKVPPEPVPSATSTPPVASTVSTNDTQVGQTAPIKKSSKKKEMPDAGSISINDAGLEDLEKLPGVGPAMAQKILDYRTQVGRFGSLEELMNVKGIGQKKFEKMAPYLRL